MLDAGERSALTRASIALDGDLHDHRRRAADLARSLGEDSPVVVREREIVADLEKVQADFDRLAARLRSSTKRSSR